VPDATYKGILLIFHLIIGMSNKPQGPTSMARKNILIIGGAGFVGSHTADALLQQGHTVRIFDNLSKQVHGGFFPSYLSSEVEFMEGDVRDFAALTKAVVGMDVIYHLAAAVGVGQSMYEISHYSSVNVQGTANLLQVILDTKSQPEKVVVASSMSIYGEGRYVCPACGDVAPPLRTTSQLRRKDWELRCPLCHETATPRPTDEDKPLQCSSIYALSKKAQEEMSLVFGQAYNFPVVALRYFNIYGPRQALSNPYTGVAAIFASRLMNRKTPMVFEDGLQMRDFVNIHDIVQANLLAMTSSGADGTALNVGSGQPVSVYKIATEIANMLGIEIQPKICGNYRAGDIRHCYADISRISASLGYRPSVSLQQGMAELVEWLESQQASDHTEEALNQLAARGLVA
jgi:dTDP-L-rhamnose 4-epimerase